MAASPACARAATGLQARTPQRKPVVRPAAAVRGSAGDGGQASHAPAGRAGERAVEQRDRRPGGGDPAHTGTGAAVLVVEHNVQFVMRLCGQVVVMNFGRKIADGSPEDVRSSEAVIEA